nr:MAG TPA: hypothetical protein [Caudoviricetes sp.]
MDNLFRRLTPHCGLRRQRGATREHRTECMGRRQNAAGSGSRRRMDAPHERRRGRSRRKGCKSNQSG